jgi:hypothetical protein
MAGVITHLVIAREILRLLPKGTVKEEGLFYLGSFAPDAIHAREGDIREYKKHTHFRDDIPDMDFELEEHQIVYHRRLTEFIAKNKDRKDGLLDLYRGYVTHILTDELFMITVRNEFCAEMNKMDIAQNDRRFFEYIVTDMNRNDLLLVKYYEDIENIRQKLEQVDIHPIDDFLSSNEMKDCREWLVHRHFLEEYELIQPRYISYERMKAFIQESADYIVKKLTEEDSTLNMF